MANYFIKFKIFLVSAAALFSIMILITPSALAAPKKDPHHNQGHSQRHRRSRFLPSLCLEFQKPNEESRPWTFTEDPSLPATLPPIGGLSKKGQTIFPTKEDEPVVMDTHDEMMEENEANNPFNSTHNSFNSSCSGTIISPTLSPTAAPERALSDASSIVAQVIKNVQMSVSQFRAFLNLLPSGVIVASKNGKISLVNEAAAEMFGYKVREMQAEYLSNRSMIRGLSILALMPPEIANIHHFFVKARMESGEHRITKTPRDVIIKVRQDQAKVPFAHKDLSDEAKEFSEELYVKELYTNMDIMIPTSTHFTKEEGFVFTSAQMTLGEITLGGERYFIAFFDRSAVERRRASLATRIAADAIGNKDAFSHLMDKKLGDTNFAKEYPEVAVVFVDVVGSTAKIKKQDVKVVFEDLNSLLSDFDQILSQHSTAIKIKTSGDGYIFAVGLNPYDEQGDSLCSSQRFSNEATVAVAIGRQIIDVAKRHTLCEHRVEVRVGIHVGSVMAGVLGSTKKVFDILGDTVSLAARMESSGVPGKIQISETTWARLGTLDQETFEGHPSSDNPKIRTSEYTGTLYLSKH